ncbi:methionine--tRNA ligase [Anoxybacter fermentans]|uniref:Methionine--tRNA ligase n=1 Tax=Anoxybacter fermentans TaxID=1323375 RepID=A0A3S9SXE5_9FIRM|nr:methionine--tRNA ligase [Anoxybacter fermentans]AZR72969.1 methionine--tRNA ligase [Anoxybacter fermentans]
MTKLRNRNKNVFIGGAWPYANGSLHLGHIAALLPGDVIAKYYRLTGANVLYVSGSDCHGTPISVKAANEGVEPQNIAGTYHNEFKNTFEKLGFDYDIYTNTMEDFHKEKVQEFIKQLYRNDLLYSKEVKQAFCPKCNRFLPDRYITGTCYNCGAAGARGDQCDVCGSLIEVEYLTDKKCTVCHTEPVVKDVEHLFIKLSKFQDKIAELVDKNEDKWRANAINLTRRYLREGIKDRAISRDLDWGISVPIKGYEDKKIYVWFEAVLGYLTASMKWAKERGNEDLWKDFWNDSVISYYIHGKDNIPFHTIIFPALLMGLGIQSLPSHIISSEYLTIEGKRLSTSRNWAIWAEDFLSRYDADPLRYFLIINGPEKRDSDFSWSEFLERNNGELLGAYGNLINRTLALVIKGFGKVVPTPAEYTSEDYAILNLCKGLYTKVGELIEKGELKEALKEIFEVIRASNKYFDVQTPWLTVKSDKEKAATTLKVCLDLILNLSNLCYPFVPGIATKALAFLNCSPSWEYSELTAGSPINEPYILVKKLDKKIIEEEVARLGKE